MASKSSVVYFFSGVQQHRTETVTQPISIMHVSVPVDSIVQAVEPAPSASRTLLIVEDFAMTSTLLSTALRNCRSIVATCAPTAELALELLKQPFNFVLCDIQMQGMGGIEFIKQLRQVERDRKWPHQSVIAMSADDAHENAALAAGADLFIDKYANLLKQVLGAIDGLAIKHH